MGDVSGGIFCQLREIDMPAAGMRCLRVVQACLLEAASGWDGPGWEKKLSN